MPPLKSKAEVIDVLARATVAVQTLPDDVVLERIEVTGNLAVFGADESLLGYVDLHIDGQYHALRLG